MALGEFDRTEKEIHQDPRDRELFAQFLGAKDMKKAKGVVDSLATDKPLTDTQNAFLDESRKAFNLRRAETARIKEMFSDEYLHDVARTDPRIARVIGVVGVEKAREIFMNQLEELAVTNDKDFKKLASSMGHAHTIENSNRAKKIDEQVAKALERMGITEETYFKAVGPSLNTPGGASYATVSELNRLAKENMGNLMSIVDIVSGNKISSRRAKAAVGAFEIQKDLLTKRDAQLKELGKTLAATITPELRVAMQRMMLHGEEMENVSKTNVNSIPDYIQVRETAEKKHSSAERQKRFAHQITKKRAGRAITSLSATEKNELREQYVEEEERLQGAHKGKGIFAALVALLFTSKKDLQAEALKQLP